MSNIVDSITNINFLSQAQFNAITAPSNNELYAVEFTPKGFNLFDYKLSNYTLNDPRWLSANAFTWQYSKYIDENYQGYGIAYNHLLNDWNTGTIVTETVGSHTFSVKVAPDGHKLFSLNGLTLVETLYAETGAADYFIIDIENERFKLPRKQKRQLIQSWNSSSSWYKLYSDGWVEQGGTSASGQASPVTVSLPIAMANGKYQIQLTPQITDNSVYDYTASRIATIRNSNNYTNSTTSFMYSVTGTTSASTVSVCWEVQGYAASVPTQTQLEYYYVGEYTIPALENTAGINTETLNNKVDRDFGNIPTGYDIVVDWQKPTAENNYKWYRKYKSGWVEQGGRSVGTLSGNVFSLTLPVPMANQEYYFNVLPVLGSSDTGNYFARGVMQTTTQIQYYMFLNNTITPNNPTVEWMVCGMAA